MKVPDIKINTMKQEDKQLLLQDLCARLPYQPLCKKVDTEDDFCNYDAPLGYSLRDLVNNKIIIKPYLRPMSSMTEEESAELSNIISEWFDKELFYLTEESFLRYALSKINYSISPLLFDFLNKNHFDYRGLIPKGLAIEAPEGMYNIKNK